MTENEQEIDRLRRQLGREAGGPTPKSQATRALVSIAGVVVTWIRRSGADRPLISILLAFEAGRWGGRRA